MRRRLSLALVFAIVTLGLLELSLRVLADSGLIALRPPDPHAGGFWDGEHPIFGVWHRPKAAFRHRSPCFDVTYHSNSVGARDVERRRDGRRPRVIVLGDSYLEGWGIPRAQRLSDLLERKTAIPHLNFAMAHFGPYQALLAYRELAREFEHTAVLIGVLPTNDFVDLDPELAGRVAGYEYRYRPYLVSEGTGFRHETLREPSLLRWLRRHSQLFQAMRQARGGERPRFDAVLGGDPAEPQRIASFFYDFGEDELARFRFVLDELVRAAQGRRVAVVLIPVLRDLARFSQSGPDPLSRRLGAWARERGALLVDLLPAMHDYSADWGRYFHACDYHWSALGNRVAAELVLDALAGPFYPSLADPDQDSRASGEPLAGARRGAARAGGPRSRAPARPRAPGSRGRAPGHPARARRVRPRAGAPGSPGRA